MAASEEQVQSSRAKGAQAEKLGDTNIMGRRAIAVIIDTAIIIFAVAALLEVVISVVIRPNLAMILLMTSLGQFFYFWILEGLTARTVGKILMGIEVRRENGSRIDFGDSFTRNLWRFIDSVLSYGVGFFVAMDSDEKQRLGDKRANTFVVRR